MDHYCHHRIYMVMGLKGCNLILWDLKSGLSAGCFLVLYTEGLWQLSKSVDDKEI